jgi:hypothetical protein
MERKERKRGREEERKRGREEERKRGREEEKMSGGRSHPHRFTTRTLRFKDRFFLPVCVTLWQRAGIVDP